MTTNLLPERPTYIAIVLALVFAMVSAIACAQTPYKDCGYSDAPPTWREETNCASFAAGRVLTTDMIIEGTDTTRIRTITVDVAGKYRWIRHDYVPTNPACSLIVCRKRVRCK